MVNLSSTTSYAYYVRINRKNCVQSLDKNYFEIESPAFDINNLVINSFACKV